MGCQRQYTYLDNYNTCNSTQLTVSFNYLLIGAMRLNQCTTFPSLIKNRYFLTVAKIYPALQLKLGNPRGLDIAYQIFKSSPQQKCSNWSPHNVVGVHEFCILSAASLVLWWPTRELHRVRKRFVSALLCEPCSRLGFFLFRGFPLLASTANRRWLYKRYFLCNAATLRV